MSTQKRRVIYLSDEDWKTAKDQAASFGEPMTVSAYIRALLNGVVTDEVQPPLDRTVPTRTIESKPLRTFSSRPFTPVPKRSK